jgi:hypothetical protein
MVFLKANGSGFHVMTLWYSYSLDGCNKGTSHLTVHQVNIFGGPEDPVVEQLLGFKISGSSNEPVGAATVVGGKLVFSLQAGNNGADIIKLPPQATGGGGGGSGGSSGGGGSGGPNIISGYASGASTNRFSIFGWSESSGM